MLHIHTQCNDYSTDTILQYCHYLSSEISYIRHNDNETITDLTINLTNEESKTSLKLKGKSLDSSNIKKYYYRRGNIAFDMNQRGDALINGGLISFLSNENKIVEKYLLDSFHKKQYNFAGFYQEANTNKLEQLKIAIESGLIIPDTIITTEKSEVLHFLARHKHIIIKPVSNHKLIKLKDREVIEPMCTQQFYTSDVEQLSDSFFPTLFQQKVEKKYEVRSFLLDGKLYSMAIFSQQDKQTLVDFRNYNRDKPNRNVPYILNEEISNKLLNTFNSLNLTTGSADLMFDHKGNYIFLEINPLGQFSWLSENCNYNVELKIAQNLVDYAG